MTKFKNSSIRGIPQWQSDKMKQIIIDRWQETWIVVETRKKAAKIYRVTKSSFAD